VAVWEESGGAHGKSLLCVWYLSTHGARCGLCQRLVGEATGEVSRALGPVTALCFGVFWERFKNSSS